MRSRRAGREACRWKSSSLVMLGSYACERRGGEPGSLSSYSPIGRGLLQQPRAKRKSSTSCAATTTARPAPPALRRAPRKGEGGLRTPDPARMGSIEHHAASRLQLRLRELRAELEREGRYQAAEHHRLLAAELQHRPQHARAHRCVTPTNQQPGPHIRLNFLTGRRVCEAGVPLTSLSEGFEILGTFTAFSRSIAQCAPSSATARTTHSELAAIQRDGKILRGVGGG